MNDPRDPIPGSYRFEAHASVIWIICLGLICVWLWGLKVVHDQAAQSACESISIQLSVNDGCQ